MTQGKISFYWLASGERDEKNIEAEALSVLDRHITEMEGSEPDAVPGGLAYWPAEALLDGSVLEHIARMRNEGVDVVAVVVHQEWPDRLPALREDLGSLGVKLYSVDWVRSDQVYAIAKRSISFDAEAGALE